MEIKKIYETPKVIKFLEKKGLKEQYIKVAKFLINGLFLNTNFKIIQPKQNRIWSFRINKQYRAFAKFDEYGNLLVFEINDHQNY